MPPIGNPTVNDVRHPYVNPAGHADRSNKLLTACPERRSPVDTECSPRAAAAAVQPCCRKQACALWSTGVYSNIGSTIGNRVRGGGRRATLRGPCAEAPGLAGPFSRGHWGQ